MITLSPVAERLQGRATEQVSKASDALRDRSHRYYPHNLNQDAFQGIQEDLVTVNIAIVHLQIAAKLLDTALAQPVVEKPDPNPLDLSPTDQNP